MRSATLVNVALSLLYNLALRVIELLPRLRPIENEHLAVGPR